MTVLEARRINLHRLFKEYKEQHHEIAGEGAVKGFAQKLKITPGYMSHLLHWKNMGHNTARKIEKELGLEPGWMDVASLNMEDSEEDKSMDNSTLKPENDNEKFICDIVLTVYRYGSSEVRQSLINAVLNVIKDLPKSHK